MSNKRAPNVGEAFNFTDDKFNKIMLPGNSSAFDDLSDADTLKSLRIKMGADGLVIDGDDRLLGMGSMGVIAFGASSKSDGASIDNPTDIPGAIVRVEYLNPVLDSNIVLQPAFNKEYEEGMLTGANYKVIVVPSAPDVEGMEVGLDDIKRTIQVLKAEGKDQTLWDIQPSAFTFVKGEDGEVLRYSSGDNVPDDFKGKPIAFVRDLNAMDRDSDSIDRVKTWLAARNIDYDKLEPATPQVLEDTKQQFALTAKLAATLEEYGIKPNVKIPEPPMGIQQAQGEEVGAGKAVQQGNAR
jgi:hypothetical protein